MEYIVLENAITGCQEFVSTAGTESSTIGCVWKSTDAYACITDCADCSLGMINSSATQLGYTASASNSSTAIGLGATACCTSTAIGNGASAIGANEVHIKGGCSEITNKCNCINISNEGSTAIYVSNTALNVSSDSNTYLNVACDCIDVKGCTAVVNVGANSVAIGANATATCGIDIKGNSAEVCVDVTKDSVRIGRCNSTSNALTNETLIGQYNSVESVDAASLVVIGSGNEVNCDATGNIIIGSSNAICSSLIDVVLIGTELGSQYDTYASDLHNSDVVIGDASSYNKLCCNGYRYHNGCLMTGRILNCAAELPASNCSLIMYYVP